MSDVAFTLIGTALIMSIPATLSVVIGRRNRQGIEATRSAVQVVNGSATEEPLGDYIHARFHSWDGRFDVMTGLLVSINSNLQELVSQGTPNKEG